MAIDSKHPLYSTFLDDWQMCRDAYRGERVVKSKGKLYLPPTPGQEADGMNSAQDAGYKAYEAYKTRALFPEFMASAVETMLGVMWSKPPVIELPKSMESLLTKATIKGESLEQLLRRINEQQLVTGRTGLLLDLPATPKPDHPLPYIAMYMPEHIINWDVGKREEVTIDSLNLVVLNESEFERNSDFEWEYKNKYRVLIIGDVQENEETADYAVGLFDQVNSSFNPNDLITPSIRGKKLQRIPFAFINSKDIVPEPDDPPLLGLVRLCMAIYRAEADYRQSLFLQGQDTLVVIGGDEDEDYRVGAGAAINLTTGGDAKFIGVSATGLGEQRQALENDKMQAANKAGELIDTRSKEKESGDALRTRVAAQTATLNQIARSGAEGLQHILRICAEWIGANPEEVIVTPNLDFSNLEMAGQDLVQLMTAKSLGAPLSLESIHKMMQDKNLTCLSFEEEMGLLEVEAPLVTDGSEGEDDEDQPKDEQ